MTLTLTPTEIHTLISAATKIADLADRTPNTAYLLGIDKPTRNNLRQILQKIHTQATQQIKKSAIQPLPTNNQQPTTNN